MKLNIQNTVLSVTAGRTDQFPLDTMPQIAFSGRSNVGKSSLVNTLLQRKKLARVSSMPGKTVTVNFYCVDKKLYIVDLPGYGFAKRTPEDIRRWSSLTDGYFTDGYSVGRLKCVVQLADLKVGLTRDDEMMLDYLRNTGTDFVIVATKSDKLNKTDTRRGLDKIRNNPLVGEQTEVIPFSSLSGVGRDMLLGVIYKYI